ncbi:MAG: response regulator transcription factor [Kordiimonadaceae bacterium]|nr:response regulator transcription factor [Kordiimonadaceae bacterium]MBO6570757.1 response regulator transcription factor [Kordiimonadaceae bacterium]MBO6965438.1 response regulator transcription factor [Kordiimonadaceae bacterium]
MCKLGKKILIVEDTKSVSMLLAATLKREGFRVDVAETIEGARQLLKRNAELQCKYDLALVDISLPDGDGAELLRELSSSSWCNARYAVSADASRSARKHALNAGADRYVTKPFDLRALIDQISDEVGRRKVIRHNECKDGLAAEKQRLAQAYSDHLFSVCKELEAPMPFKALRSRLHQLRGSAMLYGFSRLSTLASDLSDRLGKHGPSFSEDVRETLRQEIRVALSR